MGHQSTVFRVKNLFSLKFKRMSEVSSRDGNECYPKNDKKKIVLQAAIVAVTQQLYSSAEPKTNQLLTKRNPFLVHSSSIFFLYVENTFIQRSCIVRTVDWQDGRLSQ